MVSRLLAFNQIASVLAAFCLIGCKTPAPLISDLTATQANDLSLVVSGCETSLGRGVDICRFVEGSLIREDIQIAVPWLHDSSARSVTRFRVAGRVKEIESKGPSIRLPYKDLLGTDTWMRGHDGPIQIMSTSYHHNGTSTKALGYVYVIVLTKGYRPTLLLDHPFSEGWTLCKVTYDAQGRSKVKCD